MTLQELYFGVKKLYEFIQGINFQNNLNQLNQALTTLKQQQNQPQKIQTLTLLQTKIAEISNGLSKLNLATFTSGELQVFSATNFDSIIGTAAIKRIAEYSRLAALNTSIFETDIAKYIQDSTLFCTQLTQLYSTLTAYRINETIDIQYGENDGIIEIIFSEKASVNNFTEAKEEMSDWYLTIRGYASLLNLQPEEFEIISISKSSPARFKIKTTAAGALVFLNILNSILQLQIANIQRENLILQNEKYISLSSNPTLAQQAVDLQKTDFQAALDREIDSIVEEKLREKGINSASVNYGDVKSGLTTSINNQYKFITKGGEMKVFIGNNTTYTEDLLLLDSNSKKVKELQQSFKAVTKLSEQSIIPPIETPDSSSQHQADLGEINAPPSN